jgi:hypothetical protein
VDVLILATKIVLLFDGLASIGMDSGLMEEILLTRTSLFVPSRPSALGITLELLLDALTSTGTRSLVEE